MARFRRLHTGPTVCRHWSEACFWHSLSFGLKRTALTTWLQFKTALQKEPPYFAWDKRGLTCRLSILMEHLQRMTLASRSRSGLATRLYTDSPSRRRWEWISSTNDFYWNKINIYTSVLTDIVKIKKLIQRSLYSLVLRQLSRHPFGCLNMWMSMQTDAWMGVKEGKVGTIEAIYKHTRYLYPNIHPSLKPTESLSESQGSWSLFQPLLGHRLYIHT